eukprot:m.400503 g.400503  ORF g.400503 m.400503 type:complete len:235 (-) comp21159_c0_seq27:55-759(-)
MMPTLIELAGLPPCQELLGGKSLAAVIANPPANGTAAEFPYAFSQFPRCNCTYQTNDLDTLNGTCPQVYHNPYTSETGATGACNHHVCLFDPKETFDWMGYSVRSDGFRYTLFVAWDGAALKPRWDQVWGEELYDHRADRYVCTLARYRFTPIQSNPFRPLPVAFCLLFCVAFCCHDSSTCPLLHISSGLDFDTNEASEVQNVASSSTFQSVKAELRQALEQHFNSDSVTAPKN